MSDSCKLQCQCPVQVSTASVQFNCPVPSDVIQPQHVWHRGKARDFELVMIHTSLAIIAQTRVAFLHNS